MRTRSTGRLLTLFGVLLLLAGLTGALILVVAAGRRQSNAVESFARAPVGCDTTLDFAEPGEYFVFVERAGSIESVSGDCDVGADYSVDGAIDVVVTLVDPDGADIGLDRALGSVNYDIDGFVGVAQFDVDILEAGDHVMRVESDDGAFVVAVGPDPSDGVAVLFAAAAGVAIVGVVVGLCLFAVARGRRRRGTIQSVPSGPFGAPFAPVGQAPLGPPTYSQPGGPVSYGHPTVPPPVAGGAPTSTTPVWQPGPPPQAPPPPILSRYEPRTPPGPLPAPPAPSRLPTPSIVGEPDWTTSNSPAPPQPLPPRPDPGATAPSNDEPSSDEPSTSDRNDSPPVERRTFEPPPPPN